MATLRVLLVLLSLFLGSATALAESLIAVLSAPVVNITSNFTGTDIVIFGAIERDRITVDRAESYNIIITLRGAPERVVLREKGKFFGIWINQESVVFENAPSFYTLHSSSPLSTFAREITLEKEQIGLEQLSVFRTLPPSEEADAFQKAFIRLKSERKLYSKRENSVEFLGDVVFKTTIPLPANVPVGAYRLTTYLFRGNALLSIKENHLAVRKIGFEQFTFELAHQYAILYGLLTLSIAIFTGWVAGIIFQRD